MQPGYGLSVCAVHGKKRGIQNVQEVAPGQFVCRQGMECQPGAAGGPPQQQNYGMPQHQQQHQQQSHLGQMDLNPVGMNYGAPNMNSFGGMGGNGLGMGGLGGGLGGPGMAMGGLGGGGLNPMQGGLVSTLSFGAVPVTNNKQVCCIHRKERNLSSLVDVAPGSKGLRCRAEDECKLGASQVTQDNTMMECCLHGKSRSTNCLERQDDGSYRCKPESECISSVGNEKQNCSQHNKLRATEVMQMESDGIWSCKPGSKCKGSTLSRTPGVPYARPYAGVSICSLHNKKRGSKYLGPHPTVAGASTCMPGNECK